MTKKSSPLTFVLVSMLFAVASAEAVTSCWISSAPTEFTATYSPSANVRVSSSLEVTCQTNSGTQSVSYQLTPNNGLNPSGTNNRAKFGGSLVNYDLYTNSACTNLLVPSPTTITATAAGAKKKTTVHQCVKPTAFPSPNAGYHTDIETITLSVSTPGVVITGTNPRSFPVNIGVPLSCQISLPPSDINFGTYTAFSANSLAASAIFKVRCTKKLLSLVLDIGETGGVVPGTGLSYTLVIGESPSSGSNPLITTASASTGIEKTFYINGTMPARQAGTCAIGTCTGTEMRTLTLVY